MEYQKVINLLDNTPNEPHKFMKKNWVKINDESRGMYYEHNQIRFKTSMLRSTLCDFSNSYILVRGTLAVVNTGVQGQSNNPTNKKVALKNCAPFTNCINKINNTQVDDAHDINIVMPMNNLIKYSDYYSKHLKLDGKIVKINQL